MSATETPDKPQQAAPPQADPSQAAPPQAAEAPPRRHGWLVAVPLILFGALAALFYVRLYAGDASVVPSALIGRPVPAFELPAVPGLVGDTGVPVPGLTQADLQGQVTLVNVFASWCGPCQDEHPLLTDLAKDSRIRVVGINYKDRPDNARRFLGRLGNPFVRVGADANGRAAIDWGVYGVPETFVVGRDGRIAFKLVGPITEHNLAATLKPAIERAIAGPVAAR